MNAAWAKAGVVASHLVLRSRARRGVSKYVP